MNLAEKEEESLEVEEKADEGELLIVSKSFNRHPRRRRRT